MRIKNIQSPRIIGLIGASIVFVLGLLAIMFVNSFSQQWWIGLLFVMISIVYFVVAVFLKIKRDKKWGYSSLALSWVQKYAIFDGINQNFLVPPSTSTRSDDSLNFTLCLCSSNFSPVSDMTINSPFSSTSFWSCCSFVMCRFCNEIILILVNGLADFNQTSYMINDTYSQLIENSLNYSNKLTYGYLLPDYVVFMRKKLMLTTIKVKNRG